jgi:hypothetical protein
MGSLRSPNGKDADMCSTIDNDIMGVNRESAVFVYPEFPDFLY